MPREEYSTTGVLGIHEMSFHPVQMSTFGEGEGDDESVPREEGLSDTWIWRIQPLDIKPGLVHIEPEMKGRILAFTLLKLTGEVSRAC